MKKIFLSQTILLFMLLFISCDDFLSDTSEADLYKPEEVYSDPARSEGVLLYAYTNMPNQSYSYFEDIATDDMVTNVVNFDMTRVALGEWSKTFSPSPYLNNYNKVYNVIIHINDFLEHVNDVKWNEDPELNELYIKRLSGEAYGLRAWYYAELLRHFGGLSSDGRLLGFPLVLGQITSLEEGQLPRNTYKECVEAIYADCDKAIQNLPLKWTDEGLTADQKLIEGSIYTGRINAITVMALKSRVALIAASPAFSKSGFTMNEAAQYAADVMAANNGLSNLNSKDLDYYAHSTDRDYMLSQNEIFWASSYTDNSALEEQNFPPVYFGKGMINPSQNFVDCFSDINGIPISDPNATFSYSDPYSNRDPRLAYNVLYDGALFGGKQINIRKNVDNNAINKLTTSTRTGYYLRKYLDFNTAPIPPLTKFTNTKHIAVYSRYTEVLLNFAEAATIVGGKNFTVSSNGMSFTPLEVINAIRTRAGILSTSYADGVDDSQFLELVKNERRIELFFEGYRFWDLRRWSTQDNLVTELNESVNGMNISYDRTSYKKFEVEPRVFKSYQIYCPIPDNETRKYDIIQNIGW